VLGVGYGFQLFFDFAGYSLIAIGVARLFGIHLPANFKTRMCLQHLRSFGRDGTCPLLLDTRLPVLPLATLRPEPAWRLLALFSRCRSLGCGMEQRTVPDLGGLIKEFYLSPIVNSKRVLRHVQFGSLAPIVNIFSWGMTFSLICLGWVFFRAKTFTQAGLMFKAVLSPSTYPRMAVSGQSLPSCCLVVAGYFLVYWEGNSQVRATFHRPNVLDGCFSGGVRIRHRCDDYLERPQVSFRLFTVLSKDAIQHNY